MPEVTAAALQAAIAQLGPVRVRISGSDDTTDAVILYPGTIAGKILQAVREPGEAAPHSPGYYDGKTGMQPFDVIDEFGLDFYEGNVIKYLIRWRKKNGVEDLRKARTYLNRIIARAEADPRCPLCESRHPEGTPCARGRGDG